MNEFSSCAVLMPLGICFASLKKYWSVLYNVMLRNKCYLLTINEYIHYKSVTLTEEELKKQKSMMAC